MYYILYNIYNYFKNKKVINTGSRSKKCTIDMEEMEKVVIELHFCG